MFAPDDSNENGDNTTKNDNFNGTVTKEDKYKDCEVIVYCLLIIKKIFYYLN